MWETPLSPALGYGPGGSSVFLWLTTPHPTGWGPSVLPRRKSYMRVHKMGNGNQISSN